MKFADKLIVNFDNYFLADSEGQREFLINERLIPPEEIKVLGPGSICGVNVALFTPSDAERKFRRASLNIKDQEVVYVFMGRLTKDKGVEVLLSAYQLLSSTFEHTRLLLIGEDEDNYSLKMIASERVLYTGHTDAPFRLLQAGDIFCLPSFREGFGNSVIEASAMGLPVICSDIYGLQEALEDDVTGLRCKTGDVSSLFECMKRLYEDVSLRNKLGQNGRHRVVSVFSHERVTASWVEYYESI